MKLMTERVIIIRGGFTGLRLAKNRLITSILKVAGRNNYHFFPTLLYQVSTVFIELSNISYPYRRMFQEKKMSAFTWVS